MRLVPWSLVALLLALLGWGGVWLADVSTSALRALGETAVLLNGFWAMPAERSLHLGYGMEMIAVALLAAAVIVLDASP